ncbi:MAG: T9SS type A sorting domain-containing protein [Ignavibacteriaceae bacterium]
MDALSYVSDHGISVWRRPLSEMITGIEDGKNNIPATFSLFQNHPNPFNPSTVIKYDISKESFVTLKVYDILGREVVSLINEEKQSGKYQVTFNANNLSSGIYFYRIKAGEFIQTERLILLR